MQNIYQGKSFESYEDNKNDSNLISIVEIDLEDENCTEQIE